MLALSIVHPGDEAGKCRNRKGTKDAKVREESALGNRDVLFNKGRQFIQN
jgi:hypothetical protein